MKRDPDFDDIRAFIAAQLDEDEGVARSAAPSNDDGTLYHPVWVYDREHCRVIVEDGTQVRFDGTTDVDGTHAARHDPARVLAEVASKRSVLARHYASDGTSAVKGNPFPAGHCVGCGYFGDFEHPNIENIDDCPELRDLAAPYAGRPGYKPAWRVE